jgi:hypothetical protein
VRLWGTIFVALLIGLLLWAGSSGKLRAVFADNSESAPAPPGAQRPPAETIDSLLAKSLHLPGMREAIEQAQPYAVNICGLDKPMMVSPLAEEDSPEQKALEVRSQRVLDAALRTLAASSDDAVRAMSLRVRIWEEKKGAEARAELAELARTTKSAFAYRAALDTCQYNDKKPAACREINVRRLIELDPENSASWLMLAAQERAAGRADAAAAAFERAARATRHETGFGQTMAQAAQVIATHQSPTDQALATVVVIGIAMTTPVPMYGDVIRYCEKPIVDRDPQRRSVCPATGAAHAKCRHFDGHTHWPDRAGAHGRLASGAGKRQTAARRIAVWAAICRQR